MSRLLPLCFIPGFAALPALAQTPKALNIPLAAKPPVIDGDLSDPAWKDALKVNDFVRFGGPVPVSEQTDAWVTSDGQNLFIAFYCHDREPKRILAQETQRGSDAVLKDDSISIFLDSQNGHRNYSLFAVSARNTQYETIEGGAPTNQAWVGQWKSATRRVADGWICEVKIPYRLLHYRPGGAAFGLGLMRRLGRETNPVFWPNIPESARDLTQVAQFLKDMVGAPLPKITQKPVYLPYALGSVGDLNRGRAGIDVKYPFSSSVTGLLTVNPDFQTIENDVADINFSYNEQLVKDQRPFFAEGAELYKDNLDLFYSRRIKSVDEGLKLNGRSGNDSLSVIAINHTAARDGRGSLITTAEKGLEGLSRIGVTTVSDSPTGRPDNQVARVYGEWVQFLNQQKFTVTARHASSWQSGVQKGNADDLSFDYGGTRGKLRLRGYYNTLDKDFVSNLGLLTDVNRKSGKFLVDLKDQFDRGPVELYFVNLEVNRADRQTGGFFYEGSKTAAWIQNRQGLALNVGTIDQRRVQDPLSGRYIDTIRHVAVFWNQRNLFNSGGIGYDSGRYQGSRYRYAELDAGVLVVKNISGNLKVARQTLGDIKTHQTIATGTYRLDPTRTVSARLVSQNGTGNIANVGAQRGTNLYFAFAQKPASGNEVFVLLGDPNTASTKSLLTVKVVRPL